jgi:Calx-beta domain
VIGKPVTSPAKPLAGKPFTVAFKVTRSDTRTPLMQGKMVGDPSVQGVGVRHVESFRAGTARMSFIVPKDAGGKLLKVKVTIKATKTAATRVSTFAIAKAQLPAVTVSDLSLAEGNSGTTTANVPVALSTASASTVTVRFATSDGTAKAGSDYTAASGTVSFKPGETAKTIPVSIIGDTAIETDEPFGITLSNPSGATIANGSATVTITNDDTAVPVTAGQWQGATQEGNYVYFSVTSARTITQFRSNSLTENCGSGYLQGSVSWGSQQFPIASDGTFAAQYSWTGSETSGGIEYTAQTWKISGSFPTATTMNGAISLADELNYQGHHYSCSGSVTFSATLQA